MCALLFHVDDLGQLFSRAALFFTQFPDVFTDAHNDYLHWIVSILFHEVLGRNKSRLNELSVRN